MAIITRWVSVVYAFKILQACTGRINEHRKLKKANRDYIANSYIISLDPSRVVSAKETAERLIVGASDSSNPVTIEYTYNGHAAFGFEVSNLDDWLVELLLEEDDVLSVEENQPIRILEQVNDDNQHFQSTSKFTWGLDYLSWPLNNLYTYTRNGTGVTVYILDSGINLAHDEFQPLYSRATCAHEVVEVGTNCSDFHGHGTHVASVVGGSRFGMAKNVQLRSVKVVGQDGQGSMATVVAGMEWVMADRQEQIMKLKEGDQHDGDAYPTIINLSIGGGASSLLNQAISRAKESGILVVGAAGNENGGDACDMSPASSDACLTVGALTEMSEQAYFSNVGSCVDIWAPGVEIRGAWIDANNSTSILTGTSQASPHVTGLAALYMQGGMSATDTTEAIISDARYIETLGQHESPPLAAYSGHVSGSQSANVTVYLGTHQPSLLRMSAPSLASTDGPSIQPTYGRPTLVSVPTVVPSIFNQRTKLTSSPTVFSGTPKRTTDTSSPTITTSPPSLRPSSAGYFADAGGALQGPTLTSAKAYNVTRLNTITPAVNAPIEGNIPSEMSMNDASAAHPCFFGWINAQHGKIAMVLLQISLALYVA